MKGKLLLTDDQGTILETWNWVIDYEPDPEPICSACRKDRHEYCIAKKGFECWCEDEHGLH